MRFTLENDNDTDAPKIIFQTIRRINTETTIYYFVLQKYQNLEKWLLSVWQKPCCSERDIQIHTFFTSGECFYIYKANI